VIPDTQLKSAVTELKGAMARRQSDPDFKEDVASKGQVLARFQPVFSPSGVTSLTEQEFKDFLLFKNNRHWAGLQRKGPVMCANIGALRKALSVLVDESKPIEKRLDQLIPRGKAPMVPGLGRAVLTAILQVAYPDKYGVWNMTSEDAMKSLKAWPVFDSRDSFGERYLRVNEIPLFLAGELSIDLWTLDFLWWYVKAFSDAAETSRSEAVSVVAAEAEEGKAQFGLERYLQAFLEDNWDKTPLGKEWALYEEDGEIVGAQYKTGDIGRIDLLAHDTKKGRWLVIELKKDQSSDETVGQVLRYMGWVEENLARGEAVQGLIIAQSADEKLRLALKHTKDVDVLLYEVEFHLHEMQSPRERTVSH
jgi:hypothetical protein